MTEVSHRQGFRYPISEAPTFHRKKQTWSPNLIPQKIFLFQTWHIFFNLWVEYNVKYYETWVLFSSISQNICSVILAGFCAHKFTYRWCSDYPLQKSTIQLCNRILLDDTGFDWMKIGQVQKYESRVIYVISPYQYSCYSMYTEFPLCLIGTWKKNSFDF